MKAGVGYIAFFGFTPFFGLPVLSLSELNFSSTSMATGGSTTVSGYLQHCQSQL